MKEADFVKTLLIPLAVLVCMAVPTTARVSYAAPAGAVFEQARVQLERGHYADAHRSFAQLADCGHREAARIALEMRQFGPQVYGLTFNVGPKRLARWQALLAAPAPRSTQAGSHSGLACGQTPPAEAAGEEQEHWRHHGVG
jgi:hypothetical protein